MQPGDSDGISYTIQVGNAPGPDPLANASLQISVLPNPGNFMLDDLIYTTQDIVASSPIRIRVHELIFLVSYWLSHVIIYMCRERTLIL